MENPQRMCCSTDESSIKMAQQPYDGEKGGCLPKPEGKEEEERDRDVQDGE